MFHPRLFSLSNELIVKIISNLCPLDIYSCQCTCRRLNRLIIDSPIIQYTIRTTLSGVSDPLDPDIPLSKHLDAFNRWETAWREIDLRKPNASIDEPVLAENEPDVEYSFGRYFVLSREGYGISGSGYAFLDLHARSSSSHTNAALWKTVKVGAHNLMLAFAPELNVAVAIEYVRQLVSVPLFLTQLCSIRIA
jgi:F-box domain